LAGVSFLFAVKMAVAEKTSQDRPLSTDVHREDVVFYLVTLALSYDKILPEDFSLRVLFPVVQVHATTQGAFGRSMDEQVKVPIIL
jgi:hypothetical protein